MVKLTLKKRRELKEKIRSNEFTREQLMQEYDIKENQYLFYSKQVLGDVATPRGRPPKDEEVVVMETPADVPRDEPAKDRTAEIQRDDYVLPKEEKNELDPEKDYCGNCLEHQIKTELEKDQDMCMRCGVALNWGQ